MAIFTWAPYFAFAMMLIAFLEIALTIMHFFVYYKQLFFPTWAFSVLGWIMQVMYSTIEVFFWSCIVYFVVSLAPEAKRFFKYLALLFLLHQMAIGLFRTLGDVGRIMVIANIALLIFFTLGGFMLSKDQIPKWWIWAFWVLSLSYAQKRQSR